MSPGIWRSGLNFVHVSKTVCRRESARKTVISEKGLENLPAAKLATASVDRNKFLTNMA